MLLHTLNTFEFTWPGELCLLPTKGWALCHLYSLLCRQRAVFEALRSPGLHLPPPFSPPLPGFPPHPGSLVLSVIAFYSF